MSQFPEGPILDYASPAMKSPLRLADKSILTVHETTRGLDVLETLAGKTTAVGAIIFSGAMVTLFGITAINTGVALLSGLMIFYLIYLSVTLLLIYAVIESNWRETILRAEDENLILIFKSPFTLRRHQWATEKVREVHVVQELDIKTRRIVHELQIELWTQQWVKLFTGHDPPELGDIAVRLRYHLSRAVPGPAPGEPAPIKLNAPAESPDSHSPATTPPSDQSPSHLEQL